jgi:NAD(P)-dependent dehydrogenase (short-subunit alcohol dehydrogenase family)
MAHAKKTVLITGATAGIGKYTALYLHARGHHVIGTGRNEQALAELQTHGVDALKLDVTSAASIETAQLEVERITGGRGIDVLVNNAGYGQIGPIEVLSDEDVRAQFETNVFGLLAVTRAFLPGMRARGFGRVINVSSVGGRMVFPLMGIYHATKYAVEAMTDAMRLELRQFGIRVSAIEPGYIKTDFTATSIESVQKYVREDSPYAASLKLANGAGSALEPFAVGPQAVARAIERAATSRFPRARYVTPSYNVLGPLLMALMPVWLTDWLFRRVARLNRPAGAPRAPAQLSVQ